MTRAGTLTLCALWSLVAAAGCNKGTALNGNYAVLVRALDDLGKPLPDVQLSAAGQALGATDAQGQRTLSLSGVEGQRVDLAASCPKRYVGPRERPAFLLKRVRNAQGDVTDQPIEVTLTCDPTDHAALVAVQTGQAGLPIVMRGQVVGQTSDMGTAHVMLREPAGNSFQLTLDTSAKPELRPENPTRLFTVTQKDAFSVWDQPFEVEKKSGGRARQRGKRLSVLSAPPPAPSPPPKRKSGRAR